MMAEEALKELLTTLVAGKRDQDDRIQELLTAIKSPPPVDADTVRKEQVLKITQNFNKAKRLKPYKVTHDIKLFLKMFDEEIINMKAGVGLKDDLKKEEWVPIFRASLDFPVVDRVKVILTGKNKTWENIDIAELKVIMNDEFGSRQTDVAQVLNLFGQHRLVKRPDETVSEFYFRWQQNIPENMKPDGDQVQTYKDYVDLINRSLFYIALNDEDLQKALSDLKDANPTLSKYLEEACMAENRRNSFKNIAKSAVSSENRGVTISKFESKKWISKSEKSSTQGAKSKDTTKTGDTNAKYGDKGQNQKSNKKPPKQDNQNSENKSNKKWCDHHKFNKSHDTKNCFKLNKDKKSKAINHVEATEDNSDNENDGNSASAAMGFYSHFKSINAVTPDIHSFESLSEDHPMATTPPLLTGLNIEGIGIIPFEVDSGASHNILSLKEFNRLQNELKKRGMPKSKMLDKTVQIKLADGKVASQDCPVAQIHVSTNIDKFSDSMPLSFLIVKGPNCLIGRHSIARLWPSVLAAFRKKTCENFKIFGSSGIKSSKACGQINKIEQASESDLSTPCHLSDSPKDHESKSQCPLVTIKPSVHASDGLDGGDGEHHAKQIHVNSVNTTNTSKSTNKSKSKNKSKPKAKSKSKTNLNSKSSALQIETRNNLPAKSETDACLPAKISRAISPTTVPSDAHDVIASWPPRRKLPELPDGPISQELGIEYCKKLCDLYHEVFDSDTKGCFKGVSAVLVLKEGGLEAIVKSGPRPNAKVPFGLEDQYFKKLKKLYENLEPIDGQKLITASQLVPVIETVNGERILRRLAINYKSTINNYLEDVPDIFTTCSDEFAKCAGEYRTCVDLEGAYQQMSVNEELSRLLLAVVTPWGYGIPKVLMYGVKTAPALFNSAMRRILHSCNGGGPLTCAQMVDDICLSGNTPREHFENLAELLYRLYACGLKVNKDKCTFYQREVKFLGKVVDHRGVRLDPATTNAILKMPEPVDKSQLRSFLGHISYVSRHVPDLRSARASLDKLVKPDIHFVWEQSHRDAFQKCKELASNPALLTHFDPKLPIILTTDASPYGVGACLSHSVTVDGKTRLLPVAYASASLKDSQKNYSQVDREGLAVYWGITHFRQYLLCKDFTLHTDCSALVKIFGSKNDLNGCAAGRLSRWAAALMEYSFTVKHIRGTCNRTADSLSRLPVVDKNSVSAPFPDIQNATNFDIPASIKKIEFSDSDLIFDIKCLSFYPDSEFTSCTISQVVGSDNVAAWDLVPLSISEVAAATKTCKIFGKLYRAVKLGQLDLKDKDLSKFNGVFDSLYIQNDVIHFGSRICIPPVYHDRLLSELHSTHIGSISMKKVVRDLFWWPGVSRDIDQIVAKCPGCKKHKKKTPANSLSVWPFARRPMERVHVDYFEFKGKHVLIMVDAFSKKIWCHYLGTDTTAATTCAALFNWFCAETGSPTTLVSDNGPQFTSKFFETKMKLWNIKHIFSPPYHPQSNGLAERGVGLVKDRLKKMNVSSKAIDLYVSLAQICKVHGLTPHSSTDRCPFELIKLGGLPSLFPNLTSGIIEKSELTVTRHCANKLKRRKSFGEGDLVVVYDKFTKTSYDAIVSEVVGTNNYIVQCDNGFKHVSGDNLSTRSASSVTPTPTADATATDENLENNSTIDDDNLSILSDDSDDFALPDIYPNNNNNVNNNINNNNRRGFRELNSLGPIQPLSRLRSGRN